MTMSIPHTNLLKILPHEALTPLDPNVPPTSITIRRLSKELYANARSITTTLGGGNHGHLGLLLTTTDYLAIQPLDPPPTEFTMPAIPPIPRYDGTEANVHLQKANYDVSLEQYNTAHSLEKQLKNQFLKAVPRLFIMELEDQIHGFALVTTWTLLNHMKTIYGEITHNDMTQNTINMTRPWDPDTPIETVFNNMAECRQLATAGGEAVSDNSAMRAILESFKSSGLFDSTYELWYTHIRKVPEHATLANLRKHFHDANGTRLLNNPTKRSEMALIAKKAETTNPAPPTPAPNMNHVARWYCWSHGGTWSEKHTSQTCTKRAEGHQCSATLDNMMGGNNIMMRSVGEVAVYKQRARAPRASALPQQE
jgi:hypothetical protein